MHSRTLLVALTALSTRTLATPTPDLDDLEPRDGRFTYYNMKTALAGPCDLDTGPNNTIWVSDFLVPKFAIVHPDTGEVEEYPIPYTAPLLNISLPAPLNRLGFACVMRRGFDGKMYAATGVRNQMAQIDPNTKKVRLVDTGNPAGNLEPFNDMWPGQTGMWYTQTTANTISHFDYKTLKRTDYHPPTPESGPLGIFIASDGGVWFCEFFGQQIGRLDPKTGKIEEFPIKLPQLLNPAVVRAETVDKGKHYIWFCGLVGNSMGSIQIENKSVKAYPHPIPAAFPTEDTNDGNGNIWYSTLNANSLNKLDPRTGKVTIIKQPDTILPLPGGIPPAVDIAMHYGPGRDMWFTELSNNRVGRYKLFNQALPPPALPKKFQAPTGP